MSVVELQESFVGNFHRAIHSNDSELSLHDSQKVIYQPVWGTAIREKNYENALWIRLKEVPVINNWQVPTNLCQLKQICTNQGIDLLAILKSFAPKCQRWEAASAFGWFSNPSTYR